MKKILCATIILAIIFTSTVCSFATSYGNIIQNLSAELENIYEISVLNQMSGRCGATTLNGAKGISFEIMFKDKLNLENIFNPDYNTRLTFSPNATRADLVSVNSANRNVGYYQCKNELSSAGINKTIQQIKSGQYDFTNLVGTTETSELFNKKAASVGISKTMQDSGIPSSYTEKIANRALDLGITISDIESAAICGGTVCAALDSLISLAQSIINHDSFSDAFGKVTIQALEGFVIGSTSGVMFTLTSAALVGAGTFCMAILPVVAATGVSTISCILLDELVEETKVTDIIAKYAKSIGVEVTTLAQTVSCKVQELVSQSQEQIQSTVEKIETSETLGKATNFLRKIFTNTKQITHNIISKVTK